MESLLFMGGRRISFGGIRGLRCGSYYKDFYGESLVNEVLDK